jgi:hypothetical protein
MIDEIQDLLNNYHAWLKEATLAREIEGGWVEITTPYLDRHNDHLQIYARRENGTYVLTDDSYTISNLEMSGCELTSPKRRDLLNLTLNGFGVHFNKDKNALEVRATPKSFPGRKHSLIQAMLAVNDLFYLAKPTIESLFYEDVVGWLDQHDIRYTPKVQFVGTSGYSHVFDFVIPKSRREPERILKAINHPSRNTAESMVHAWTDTRPNRTGDARAFAVLNDLGGNIPSGVPEALKAYEITPMPWSRREDYADELAA